MGQRERQANAQKDWPIYWHGQKTTDHQNDRNLDCWTDEQSDRQTDRQPNRIIDSHVVRMDNGQWTNRGIDTKMKNRRNGKKTLWIKSENSPKSNLRTISPRLNKLFTCCETGKQKNKKRFLVLCYATLHPALSVRRSIGPSVGPSVCPSVHHTLLFLGFWDFWLHCPCQMIWWPQLRLLPNRRRLG